MRYIRGDATTRIDVGRGDSRGHSTASVECNSAWARGTRVVNSRILCKIDATGYFGGTSSMSSENRARGGRSIKRRGVRSLKFFPSSSRCRLARSSTTRKNFENPEGSSPESWIRIHKYITIHTKIIIWIHKGLKRYLGMKEKRRISPLWGSFCLYRVENSFPVFCTFREYNEREALRHKGFARISWRASRGNSRAETNYLEPGISSFLSTSAIDSPYQNANCCSLSLHFCLQAVSIQRAG